jgi:hypothetical protein
MEQVDYRLSHGAGCNSVLPPDPDAGEQVQDRQVGYRLDAADRSLECAGNGLRELNTRTCAFLFPQSGSPVREPVGLDVAMVGAFPRLMAG